MDSKQFFIYLLILALSTYLIRTIPFVCIKKQISNKYVNSFLHYIPYTVLASMTFPASLFVTGNVFIAILGLVMAFILSIKKCSLTVVALSSCAFVLLLELIMTFI